MLQIYFPVGSGVVAFRKENSNLTGSHTRSSSITTIVFMDVEMS